ncbi:MAG: tRNA (adenosine(37)-N6)-threonylcarbamoyltransferase complex dimerization subunit type 1 TsaB [Ruminococcaceae bacterium]|nr:tRNA (adenosine(37)-N6)-threonylcarbamoyltransferase complex dimerization subunit type 1 TsaB [Oscillospiraceae bacterium]
MNILAIDTSSQNATVALLSEERLIGEFTINNKKTHSQIIMPLIDDMISKSGLDIKDIDVFACGVGPGSFTGLRIGIATAKALAQAVNKKVVGVSSLSVLANSISFSEKLVCPIIDARRNDVYNALYKDGKCIKEDRAINIEDLIKELNGNETVFVGDGIIPHKDLIISKMGDKAYFAPQSIMMAKASAVAQIALERALNNSFDDIYNLEPVYLRSSQAEREYNNRVKENLE